MTSAVVFDAMKSSESCVESRRLSEPCYKRVTTLVMPGGARLRAGLQSRILSSSTEKDIYDDINSSDAGVPGWRTGRVRVVSRGRCGGACAGRAGEGVWIA